MHVEPTSAPNPSTEQAEHRARRIGKYALQGFVAAGVFIATAWSATTLLDLSKTSIATSVSTVVLLLAVMVLMLTGALAHEVLYWRLPTMRLRRLIEEVRRGTVPVESLDVIERGPGPLVKPIQELVLEIRAHKTQIVELNGEMRQRIASRTDALERKLGAMHAKAARDGLTGVNNRRTFDEEYGKTIDACRSARRDLILLMVDVDYFKNLNDTLGHQAGDDLLRSIGQVIRSTIRDTDTAYRYGGDEFVILLPGADMVSAKALSDRLRYLVDGLTKHNRNLNPRPQLSIGIASLFEDVKPGAPDAQLLASADQRLYAIKHARPRKSRLSA